MSSLSEENIRIVIANPRNVPFYRYDERHDDINDGFKIYYSKKYLRRQRKLNEKRRTNRV
jgi:fatty acid desaturase